MMKVTKATTTVLLSCLSTKAMSAFVSSPNKITRGGWVSTTKSVASPTVALHLQRDDDIFAEIFNQQQQQQQDQAMVNDEKSKLSDRFATGEALQNLRTDLESLRENLRWAEAMEDFSRIQDLREAIETGEKCDPDFTYAKALGEIEKAKKIIKDSQREHQIQKWAKEAAAAREYVAGFNLGGLWVGNYGDQAGYEMINVTYSGDTLIATKVTGDKNVPRGQISFKVNMAPSNDTNDAALEPIKLSEKAASKWGTDKLPRYQGEGQVAGEGFANNKFVDGQLIMFDGSFSFVWIPSKHHVFFGRPNAETTIRMLRDIISEEDEVENMRDYLERCWDTDVTTSIARHHGLGEPEPFRRIKREHELLSTEGTLEPKSGSRFNFWQVNKWKQYLDDVLRDDASGNH
jgi:hypothetical protein